MRVHPRESVVLSVEFEVIEAVAKILERHPDLTEWEEVRILTSVFNRFLSDRAKMGIRMERHGTYEKEGGLE